MRRARGFVPTLTWAAQILLDEETIQGEVLDCCSGDDSISLVIRGAPLVTKLTTNDMDPERDSNLHFNAAKKSNWENLPRPHWVVTKPPFIEAGRIIPAAVDHAIYGVAALLRLSFLEPTYDRQDFLSRNPPTKLIVLPRMDANDSITSAWMVWHKNRPWDSGSILVLEK